MTKVRAGIACALVLLVNFVAGSSIAQTESPVYAIRLEIDGVDIGAGLFTSCTRLESRSEVLKTFTSGRLFPDKEPGLVSFAEFTCTKPLDRTTFQALSDWRATVEEGQVVRRSISYIFLDLNAGGQEVFRFNLFETWPSAYGIECSVGNVCVEKLTIAYEWFELG